MDVEGATLSLKITQDGVPEAERGFARVGTAGDAAASKVTQAFKQQTAAAQQFGTALGQLSSNEIATSVARYDRMIEAQKRSAMSMEELALAADRYDAAMRRRALTEMDAMEMNDAFNGKFIESRRIVLEHAEALEIDAAAQNASSAAAGGHGLQLGRLRMELGTLVGRLTGTSTALDRMGGAMAAMSLGNGIVIGVLAGVAAIGFAYEKITEQSRKAKEEQDKLTDSLKKWYETQSNGAAGDRLKEVAATLKLIGEQQSHLNDLNARLNSPTANRSESVEAAIKADIAKTTALMAQERAAIQAGGKDITQTEIASFNEQRQAQATALADRIKFNADDARARGQALTLLKQDQALYAQYLKLPATPENSALIAEMTKQITTLSDALFPKQKVQLEAVAVAHNELSAALDKELEEWRKVAAENADGQRRAQQDAELAKVQGESHELLASKYKAENETIQALRTTYGVALTERIAGIEAEKQQRDAMIRQTQVTKDQNAAQQLLNVSVQSATAIGTRNTQALHDQAVAQQAAFDKINASLSNDLLRGIEQFANKGVTSFRSFFQEVESMATRMVEQINKSLVDAAKNLNAGQIAQLKQYQQYAVGVGSAAAGGLTGYQVGSQTGNTTKGVLAGGATGAVVGEQIGHNSDVPFGGLIGAAIGGLAGAVGGLLGASDAQKKAAEALQKAADQAKLSLLQMNVQAGTGTALDANLEQLRQQSNALYDAIDAALPGLKNQIEREKELAQVRKDQAIITAALIEAEKNQSAANIQDYNQRAIAAGASGGSLEQQNDAALRNLELQQSRALAAAINRHASAEELAALTIAQSIEKQVEVNRENDAIRQRDQDAANAAIQAKLDEAAADRQATIDVLNDQLKTANDLLTVNRAQLESQQQAVNATKQVVDSLKQFSQSLLTGNLSTLSPIDQVNEAKRQRDALFQQARGGDQNAAGQYGSAAQTYLQLAQQYFASSPGYASAFGDTQSQTQQLTDQFGTQLDVQQQILATLQASNDKLTTQIAVLQKQLDIATGTRADQLLAEVQGHGDSTTVTRVAGELAKLGYGLGEGTRDLGNGMSAPDYNYTLFNRPLPSAADYPTAGGTSYNDSTGQYQANSANTTATMVQAGSNAITDKLDLVLAALDTNATVTRRGFADLAAAVKS